MPCPAVSSHLILIHLVNRQYGYGCGSGYAIKWDGEWQVTYETFRDMGLAYAVGLVLIYLLVVAQFRSYVVPLVIMAPIPLTIIGVSTSSTSSWRRAWTCSRPSSVRRRPAPSPSS